MSQVTQDEKIVAMLAELGKRGKVRLAYSELFGLSVEAKKPTGKGVFRGFTASIEGLPRLLESAIKGSIL